MGGFFAAWLGLAVSLALPFMAINPATNSTIPLRKHTGEFETTYGTRFFLKQKTVDEYNPLPFRMDGNGFVALVAVASDREQDTRCYFSGWIAPI